VFPQIKENNYYTNGVYRIDSEASPIMKNCLMYKLCYYRFDEVTTQQGRPTGFDTVRSAEIGHKGFKLKHFREAYTSERWIVRIYEVMPLANMDPAVKPKNTIPSSVASAPTPRIKIATKPTI
jgi:dolichyl-diphosphooligosaccharide--protein glycosyltransferase